MFSLLDNSAAGFSLEMEIRIYQDENLYMYLHTRLQKLRKRKSIIVHMMQGCRTRGGPRGAEGRGDWMGNHLPRFRQEYIQNLHFEKALVPPIHT